MGRTLTEQKVLKKLGIPDFRHMTKDKIVRFATMMPKMDPEVAKKALEQFPEFSKTAQEILSYFKDFSEKGLEKNAESVNSFYQTCDAIIETLQEQLQDDKLTAAEKQVLIEKMVEVARMKGEKDSENKKFIREMVGIVGTGAMMGIGIIAAALGVQTQMGKLEASDENEEDDLNVVDSK